MPACLLLLVAVLQRSASAAVMVVPPEPPAGQPDLAWVGEAIADGLPDALAFLGVPVVTRDDRLAAQELLEIPRVPLTRATHIRIAEALGASRMVLGTYAVEGDRLDLSMRVLDIEGGVLSSPFIASGSLDSLAERLDSLAWDIALSGPSAPVKTRQQLRERQTPVPFETLKAYAQGLAAGDAPSRQRLLTRALSLDPAFDTARLALGRLHLETREFTTAHDTLARMPEGSPHFRRARFLQGAALIEMGRYRDAAALYESLTVEEPSPAVLNNRAIALFRAGVNPPAASSLLRQAAEKDPDSADVAFNLGWVLLNEGDPEAAAFWLRGVVRDDPRDTHAQLVLAWALRRAGRTDDADREWKAVADVAPAYEGMPNLDPSRRFERILPSERSMQLDRESRNDVQLANNLMAEAERLEAAGDAEAALRELTRAAHLDPRGPRVHLLLARSHQARGEMEQALGELRMSLWSREDPQVRLELARLLREAGRVAEARAEAERVLKADPDNAAAREILEKP